MTAKRHQTKCSSRLQHVAVKRNSLPDVVKRLEKLEKINYPSKKDFSDLQCFVTQVACRQMLIEMLMRGDDA